MLSCSQGLISCAAIAFAVGHVIFLVAACLPNRSNNHHGEARGCPVPGWEFIFSCLQFVPFDGCLVNDMQINFGWSCGQTELKIPVVLTRPVLFTFFWQLIVLLKCSTSHARRCPSSMLKVNICYLLLRHCEKIIKSSCGRQQTAENGHLSFAPSPHARSINATASILLGPNNKKFN